MQSLTDPSSQELVESLYAKQQNLQELTDAKKKEWEKFQREADHAKITAGQAYDAWMKALDATNEVTKEIYLLESNKVES